MNLVVSLTKYLQTSPLNSIDSPTSYYTYHVAKQAALKAFWKSFLPSLLPTFIKLKYSLDLTFWKPLYPHHHSHDASSNLLVHFSGFIRVPLSRLRHTVVVHRGSGKKVLFGPFPGHTCHIWVEDEQKTRWGAHSRLRRLDQHETEALKRPRSQRPIPTQKTRWGAQNRPRRAVQRGTQALGRPRLPNRRGLGYRQKTRWGAKSWPVERRGKKARRTSHPPRHGGDVPTHEENLRIRNKGIPRHPGRPPMRARANRPIHGLARNGREMDGRRLLQTVRESPDRRPSLATPHSQNHVRMEKKRAGLVRNPGYPKCRMERWFSHILHPRWNTGTCRTRHLPAHHPADSQLRADGMAWRLELHSTGSGC